MDGAPPGYEPPVVVYLVEEMDAEKQVAQVGAFFDETEADALVARLAAEVERRGSTSSRFIVASPTTNTTDSGRLCQ